MASATRFKTEHELARLLWMKKPKAQLQPPWEFFANLCITDPVSMRRVAEHLHYSLYEYPPGEAEKHMTKTEIFEVRRMLDEANCRKEYKESGFGKHKDGKHWKDSLTPVVEKTNELLFNILEYFADSWQNTDAEIVRRSGKIRNAITIHVRQLDAYKGDHAIAKVKWEKFEKKEQAEQERIYNLDMVPSPGVEQTPLCETSEDEEENSTPTSYTGFVATDDAEIEEQPSSIADPEVESDVEDESTDIAEGTIRPSIVAPARRNISLSSTIFTGADDYNPEDERMFDTELFQRINLEDAGNETRSSNNRGFYGERMHTENYDEGMFGVTSQVRRNDGFQSAFPQREVSGDRATNMSMLNEGTARYAIRDVDRMENDTGMITSDAFTMSNDCENKDHRNSAAETVIATKARRGRKRKSTADNRSDSSTSAESVNIFLESSLPKEGRTTRSGRGYNRYTGETGMEGTISSVPGNVWRSPTQASSSERTSQRGTPTRGRGRPPGRGRGYGRGRGRGSAGGILE